MSRHSWHQQQLIGYCFYPHPPPPKDNCHGPGIVGAPVTNTGAHFPQIQSTSEVGGNAAASGVKPFSCWFRPQSCVFGGGVSDEQGNQYDCFPHLWVLADVPHIQRAWAAPDEVRCDHACWSQSFETFISEGPQTLSGCRRSSICCCWVFTGREAFWWQIWMNLKVLISSWSIQMRRSKKGDIPSTESGVSSAAWSPTLAGVPNGRRLLPSLPPPLQPAN